MNSTFSMAQSDLNMSREIRNLGMSMWKHSTDGLTSDAVLDGRASPARRSIHFIGISDLIGIFKSYQMLNFDYTISGMIAPPTIPAGGLFRLVPYKGFSYEWQHWSWGWGVLTPSPNPINNEHSVERCFDVLSNRTFSKKHSTNIPWTSSPEWISGPSWRTFAERSEAEPS